MLSGSGRPAGCAAAATAKETAWKAKLAGVVAVGRVNEVSSLALGWGARPLDGGGSGLWSGQLSSELEGRTTGP